MRNRNKSHLWMDKIIRGQECIVADFGLGRVVDFGHEYGLAGHDYVAVRFHADPTHPQIRRFPPYAVNLIDPTGKILGTYPAQEEPPKKRAVLGGETVESREHSTPIQSRTIGGRNGRRMSTHTSNE